MKPLEPRQVAINMCKKYTQENPRDVALDYRSFYSITDKHTEKNYYYWNAVIEEIEMIQNKIKNRD
jgi:hypothetical protein